MDNKFYAVFKLTWNENEEDAQSAKDYKILFWCLDHSMSFTGWDCERNTKYEDGWDGDAKRRAQDNAYSCREWNKHEREGEWWRYNEYKDKFIVHECDSRGRWKVSNAEAKKAFTYLINKRLEREAEVVASLEPDMLKIYNKVKAQLTVA